MQCEALDLVRNLHPRPELVPKSAPPPGGGGAVVCVPLQREEYSLFVQVVSDPPWEPLER